MATSKSLWIVSFSTTRADPRVMRQLWALHEEFRITVFGYGDDPCLPDVRFVSLGRLQPIDSREKIIKGLRLARRDFESSYWKGSRVRALLLKAKSVKKPDVVLANDIETLPVFIELANGAPVVFDAHEFSPRQFENRLLWRFLFQPFNTYLCREYLPPVSSMMTVCGGIADEYSRLFGVDPSVVTNAPRFQQRDISTLDPDRVRLVHHGGAMPSRKIENMIKMMEFLDDRFELDLVLVPSDRNYLAKLKERSAGSGRINFVDPVPMEEIAASISKYDIGVYLLEPYSFNARHALPNKFFEFIHAGLALAIGPSEEMARIVNRHSLGVVSETFQPEDLACQLNALSADQIRVFKQRSLDCAQTYSFETNAPILREVIVKALSA